MCISAGRNGACLIKMAREEIRLLPRSKVILRHAQQNFDTISSEVFLLSNFCVPGKTSVIRVGIELRLWLVHSLFYVSVSVFLFHTLSSVLKIKY